MIQKETSQGTLLGGKVTYRQYCEGHRSGFEPVLMAALAPVHPQESVLEVGTGAGAALLCLAARIPDVRGIGVERNPLLAQLAAQNFAENNFRQMTAVTGDAACLPFVSQSFQHVMANPPWFDVHNTPSADELRAMAHHTSSATLGVWIGELLRVLRDQGTITLALPAFAYAQAVALLRPLCGGITLFPLWPRAGVKAKVILIQARKASRAPDSVLPGLILHDKEGITRQAEAILREGYALAGQ